MTIKKRLLTFVLGMLLIPALTSFAGTTTPLPADQAFQFSAAAKNNETILAKWQIAPGYYLYKDKLHFRITNPSNGRHGQAIMPDGKVKNTPGIGAFSVYDHTIIIPVPVIYPRGKTITLQANYQGCSAKGFCYPPTQKIITLDLSGPYGMFQSGKKSDLHGEADTLSASNATNHIQQWLKEKSLWAVLMAFFGFGLLIAFTPCVLPMIPILSSIILGQKKLTTGHAFRLSLAYVFGMAMTYAIAGMLFGFVGQSLQAVMQQPWIIVAFSLIFILMALSLFGCYNIELPEKWRSHLAGVNDQQSRGTYLGAALMGCFSTLVLSPCVTPPLVAVLGFISQSGDIALGGLTLFVMGLGMGLPLLIIGASGAKLLPKTGAWMNTVKTIMGLMMIGVAIWMLQRLLPDLLDMLLWATFAVTAAVMLGAFKTVNQPKQYAKKGVGILCFTYAIVLTIGGILGSNDPLDPLPVSQRMISSNPMKDAPSLNAVKQALDTAKRLHKPVMLDFYADWCVSCQEMEHETFSDPAVQKALKSYILLRADVTEDSSEDRVLMRHFRVVAPPTLIFFDENGKWLRSRTLIGEMGPHDFIEHLKNMPTDKR